MTALALALCTGVAPAQNPAIPPFYQTYGGLFYPTQEDHRAVYGSPSDFVWGMGMGLPMDQNFLYLIVDLSWFKTTALTAGATDVTTELNYHFFHVGLLNKIFLARALAFRAQGGINYNYIRRLTTPAGGVEVKDELGRKIGFFGGMGFESLVAGGRMSIFIDALYDYRRSTEPVLRGDFGGVRIVGGLTVYWF